jgi:uncharacterized membrane protein YcaP (DUF421 family)
VVHHLVHLGISPYEKFVRTISIYVVILGLIHLSGKRALLQLTSFDLVVLLLLSNVVQNAIIGNDLSLAGGILGAVILFGANQLFVRATFKSPRLSKALQGTATVVARDGQIDHEALRKLSITPRELVAGLRRQGMELEDTIEVTLEPEGFFNAKPKPRPSLDDVLQKLDEIERRLPTA